MTAPEHAADRGAMPQWLSTATKGAASELLASVHLMRQGWHVYRCASPAAPFDLLIYREGQTKRVEVKSVNWGSRLRVGPSTVWPANDEWDLLIVVDPDDGSCIEITTHDPVEGRNQIRATHGFPPVPPRAPREERPAPPPLPVRNSALALWVLDLLRRDPQATWTCSAIVQHLLESEPSSKLVRDDRKLVTDALDELTTAGLAVYLAAASKARIRGRYRAVVCP